MAANWELLRDRNASATRTDPFDAGQSEPEGGSVSIVKLPLFWAAFGFAAAVLLLIHAMML